jgi:chorismate mutase / prephenate dehydratase
MTSNLYFLGPKGSYSHRATTFLFGDQGVEFPCPRFEEVFSGMEKEPGYAVVPLENNTAGAIDPAIDLLIASDLSICGEFRLPVCHALLSSEKNIADVKVLYSMVQPYYQSYRFVQAELSHARWEPCSSSSEAIARCCEHGAGSAAIGFFDTGIQQGLQPLAQNIQDRNDNSTRFVVLSKKSPYKGELISLTQRRCSVVFTLEDRPGTLLEILQIFQNHKLNMSHIESRPARDSRWNYYFLITLESEQGEENRLKEALKMVQDSVPWSRSLGSYPVLKS